MKKPSKSVKQKEEVKYSFNDGPTSLPVFLNVPASEYEVNAALASCIMHQQKINTATTSARSINLFENTTFSKPYVLGALFENMSTFDTRWSRIG